METNPASAHPVVLKIGGSLLDRGQPLPQALFDRIDQESRSRRVIVLFGGGQKVDRLREEHRLDRLTDDQAHWQAIDMMDQHAKEFLPYLSKFAQVIDFDRIDEASCQVVALQVGGALRADITLPIGWQVTSDSIAAWVAQKTSASRLILAKSVGQTGSFDPVQARLLGWVDEHFPVIGRDLIEVGCVLEWINAREVRDTAL